MERWTVGNVLDLHDQRPKTFAKSRSRFKIEGSTVYFRLESISIYWIDILSFIWRKLYPNILPIRPKQQSEKLVFFGQ